ncbi:serine/arginine repetitive matrix protein 2 isoform X1 [Cheilinus undulatus]|uniref:serine/arginine repetitive matrix protein 2 isoform X1 n=1 Tax=Cheilinus undulatus TaxID=241271 RepID=UPI001BD2307B|nr:serine/arginine repetitive matrix protein 2 isoform X1 [Cheilinus undulatus]
MASQCKRQQCTIDRRGFRQELDSWRHKLIHCVGFESILEGLFGSDVVQDLKLFKDLEPTTVSDWSFDENCLFCCLRRDKVKEHLIGLGHEGPEDTPKPLQVRDQTTISRLEKQAEEFLHAVLSRKDVPNFSDPHIPVVAREILQRMIKQFAAEYTSKTSPSQDSCSDSQPLSDQSLPTPPLISGAPPSTSPAPTLAGPAHNQNPVLSKLLMADQDAPLDLTIKKPQAVPSDQDGVLDLSIKKNRYSGALPVRSPCLSPATSVIKGESPELLVSKAKDLQSTSTLEHFMAKLCRHHQRQIVDAIGFLQTEVKALASTNSQHDSISTSGIQGTTCSTPKSSAVTPEKSLIDLRFPSESTPKSEVHDMSYSIQSTCATKNAPEKMGSPKTSAAGPALDFCSSGLKTNQALVTAKADPAGSENKHHGDHAPLRLKIMTSNVAAGKRLSCVLNSSLSSHSDTDREGNLNSSSRTETHSARLSSSIKRHNQSSSTHQARQRETLRHAKDSPTKLFSVHVTIPPDSPRTARKTIKPSSDHQVRESAYKGMVDPDLGHCDIVFIDKPITECFKKRHSGMVPRRNARKSTRGHMYSDEIWELKTVRTLAGRGNCPNPMPELITLVTPKQVLSKPEGVPPVNMPFAGTCTETMIQQMSTEQSDESVIPGTGDTVEVAASEVDIVVETSQTDQSQNKGQSVPSSPKSLPTESIEINWNTDVQQRMSADSGMTTACEESACQTPSEAEKDKEPEPREEVHENTEQMITETVVESVESTTAKEAETQLSSDEPLTNEPILELTSTPKPVDQIVEDRETEESKIEMVQDEQPQEMQPETQTHNDNTEVTEMPITTDLAEEQITKEPEIKASEAVDGIVPLETEDGNDNDDSSFDVSTKTLDALLKELPPWRKKKGSVVSLPKRLQQNETVVVGYVNGRPVSSSDRSLRRRSGNSISPNRTPVKPKNSNSNKNSVNPTAEDKCLVKNLPETPVQCMETSPVTEQVKEPTSTTAEFFSKTKQTKSQKKIQSDKDTLPVLSDQLDVQSQSTKSKWQLRSAIQMPTESQASPPTSNADPSILSPKPAATHAPSSTENMPLSPLPSPLPVTPQVSSSLSAATEQSQENTVQETAVESNPESDQVQTVPEDIQNNEEDSLQSKKKPRSAKAIVNNSKDEKQQPSSVESSPLESQSPTVTEVLSEKQKSGKTVGNNSKNEKQQQSSEESTSLESPAKTEMPSQKLRSGKAVVNDSKNEKQQPSVEESRQLESPAKSETPSKKLRSGKAVVDSKDEKRQLQDDDSSPLESPAQSETPSKNLRSAKAVVDNKDEKRQPSSDGSSPLESPAQSETPSKNLRSAKAVVDKGEKRQPVIEESGLLESQGPANIESPSKKLRSAKVVVDNKDEKQQTVIEVSSPLESPAKSKTPSKKLRSTKACVDTKDERQQTVIEESSPLDSPEKSEVPSQKLRSAKAAVDDKDEKQQSGVEESSPLESPAKSETPSKKLRSGKAVVDNTDETQQSVLEESSTLENPARSETQLKRLRSTKAVVDNTNAEQQPAIEESTPFDLPAKIEKPSLRLRSLKVVIDSKHEKQQTVIEESRPLESPAKIDQPSQRLRSTKAVVDNKEQQPISDKSCQLESPSSAKNERPSPKLRSTKAVVDNKDEKQQSSCEESSPLESPAKSETPSKKLRSAKAVVDNKDENRQPGIEESSPLESPSPAKSEKPSQKLRSAKAVVENKAEKHQPSGEEDSPLESTAQSESPSKKLRSGKAVVDDKDERQQTVTEESSPLESPSPSNTEPPSKKLRSAKIVIDNKDEEPGLPESQSPAKSETSSQKQRSGEAAVDNSNNGVKKPSIEESSPLENQSPSKAETPQQKPRSVKAQVDNKDEKQQSSSEESSPLEGQSSTKTEMPSKSVPVRTKRVYRTEVEALKLDPIIPTLEDSFASGDDSSSSDKPSRMPLRSERNKIGKSPSSVTQTPVDNKKSALRSQRLTSPPTCTVTVAGKQSDIASPVRIIPEKITKALVKSPPESVQPRLSQSSATPVTTTRLEPRKQTNKFMETLNGEENQHLITNLNLKYDKMQRGWVQMDKEGQPVTKHKNKADRQAAIWRSKRRIKKTKSLEHQKYSPVQMLFMKGFNLTSICRWFLESTETKSLVIVKKVNTRLPSETQLCFHSASGVSGTPQGVFPSLQAERLKKHLKKFAVASPVKSNPKSQKLIAKALEQEAGAVKGKEKKELVSTAPTLMKSQSSAESGAQVGESQKSSGKTKNPASARILRKYSNIREKMQVQQTNVRLSKTSKTLKTNNLKQLESTKPAAKSVLKPSVKAQKSPIPVSKRTKESAAKIEKKKTSADKKPTKQPVQDKAVKAQSNAKASKETSKKKSVKRSSLRLGSPKTPEPNPVEKTKSKADSKKQAEAEKAAVEKPTVNKMNAAKIQTNQPSQTVAERKVTENAVDTPQQSSASASSDQVLTRSQRKSETVVPSTNTAPKKTTKSTKNANPSPKAVRKAAESTPTKGGASRSPTKRVRPASLPHSSNKASNKKTEQDLGSPAKRTRTSLAK